MRSVTMVALLAVGLSFAAPGVAADTTFILNASVACCEAGEHRFGWLEGAATGLDPADVPEPPPPLGAYLAAAFHLPGVTNPALWRRDLRAAADFEIDGRETWELTFAVSSLPAACTVTVTAGTGEASGLLLLLSGAVSDTLTVPAAITFPMGSDSRLYLEVVDAALATAIVPWGEFKSRYR